MNDYRPLSLLLLFLLSFPVLAQRNAPETMVVMNPDELQSLVRKIAELRRRRAAYYRARPRPRPQAPARRERREVDVEVVYDTKEMVDPETFAVTPQVERREIRRETRPAGEIQTVREVQAGGYDTIIAIDPVTFAPDTIFVERPGGPVGPTVRQERRIVDNPRTGRVDTIYSMDTPDFMTKEMRPTASTPEREGMAAYDDAELRRRLDRQEELLLSMQRRLERDEYVRRRYDDDNQEINRLNQRISDLQRDLDREARERRYAEERLHNERYRESRITPSRQDYYGRRERKNRVNIGGTPRPPESTDVTIAPPAPTTTSAPTPIRDTVYIERNQQPPTLNPAPPRIDTVVIVKETQIEKEPIIVRERVVERDTVKMAAMEPIAFPAIFFGNNSANLTEVHRTLLQDVAEQVFGRADYQVVLTGYASPSGNAAYNQELSARRARAVRDGLVAVGIEAERVRIISGGIDYQPRSAAAARRVEVKAVPRR